MNEKWRKRFAYRVAVILAAAFLFAASPLLLPTVNAAYDEGEYSFGIVGCMSRVKNTNLNGRNNTPF